jgi:hypothetical protein
MRQWYAKGYDLSTKKPGAQQEENYGWDADEEDKGRSNNDTDDGDDRKERRERTKDFKRRLFRLTTSFSVNEFPLYSFFFLILLLSSPSSSSLLNRPPSSFIRIHPWFDLSCQTKTARL